MTRPVTPMLKLGDKVELRSDSTRRGVVVGQPRRRSVGYEYEVFIDGQESWYSESQLQLIASSPDPRWVRLDEFIRELAVAKLRTPLSDALYAHGASRTIFEPYQFRPALKFLRNPNQRLLIADEVGLGKTIEAAIIYQELKARIDVPRVMVLCPSRLTAKWRGELAHRFGEDFQILDAKGTRQLLADFQRVGTGLPFRVIVSFELMRRMEFIQSLVESNIPLDLLIVDEAHHMRNEGGNTYQVGAILTNVADAVVFLTATPLHLKNRDLFNLLNLLAPEDFPDHGLFEAQIEPNRHINHAIRLVQEGELHLASESLRNVERTTLRARFTSNPFYRQTIDKLVHSSQDTSLPERILIQRELMELNTLSTILSRTRKREVSHAAVRAPYTIKVNFTVEERALYDQILSFTRAQLRAKGRGAMGFAAVMRERQAASCLPALREEFLRQRGRGTPVSESLEQSEYQIHRFDDGDPAPSSPRGERFEREDSLERILKTSKPLGDDSKFRLFEQALGDVLRSDPTSKALVFSYFKGTLEYLRTKLREAGYRVDVIHGDVKLVERQRIIDTFASEPEFRVLLSSEVGSEGLDFQFCDVLFNYDLPWNPMQLEQRIGRLDRFGQKHDRIRIYNFCIDETIETRIFERLYSRIHLFEQSIGELEGILGEEVRNLSMEVLQATLTPREEERLADQAAARIIRRQREAEDLESQRDELLGQGRIFDQQIDDTISSGRVISPDEVRVLVGTFIRSEFPASSIEFDDIDPCATLDFDPRLAEHLQRFIERRKLHNHVSERLRTVLTERKRMPFTYNSDYARQRANLEFVNAWHPIAQAALDHWDNRPQPGLVATTLSLYDTKDLPGSGYFFVYLIEVRGASPRVSLVPVVVRDDQSLAMSAANCLLKAVQTGAAQPCQMERSPEMFAAAQQTAADEIASQRASLEAETRKRNEALIVARRTAIRSSFQSKISRLSALLDQANDERIRRMRRSQISNLEHKMKIRLEDLERQRDVEVSSRLLAGGRLMILD